MFCSLTKLFSSVILSRMSVPPFPFNYTSPPFAHPPLLLPIIRSLPLQSDTTVKSLFGRLAIATASHQGRTRRSGSGRESLSAQEAYGFVSSQSQELRCEWQARSQKATRSLVRTVRAIARGMKPNMARLAILGL